MRGTSFSSLESFATAVSFPVPWYRRARVEGGTSASAARFRETVGKLFACLCICGGERQSGRSPCLNLLLSLLTRTIAEAEQIVMEVKWQEEVEEVKR